MPRVTIRGIIKTSIVTAFTIAAALIWKDVIMEVIDMIASPGDELTAKILVAVLATVFVVIAIYVILKGEAETTNFLNRIHDKQMKVQEMKHKLKMQRLEHKMKKLKKKKK